MKLLMYDIKAILIYFYNIFFRKGVYSNNVDFRTVIGKGSVINKYANVDKTTVIGRYSYIGKGTCVTKTVIGNYCSIANNVFIGQGEHDIYRISTSVQFYGDPFEELTKKDCIIKNDVWIGANSCILRGVTIGTGAIVGAGAVVTKDVPAYAIAVGVPAKVIKYRFSQEKIKRILESEWWDKELKEAEKIMEQLE